MSRWTHSICDGCWERLNPDREPVRFVEEKRQDEGCCFCGGQHRSGIYVRHDPRTINCNGEHGDG